MNNSAAHEELLERAAMYALGALDPAETAAFEQHLAAGCEVCRQELENLSSINAALAFNTPPSAPPERTRASLQTFLRRLADSEAADSEPKRAAATKQLLTVRAGEGDWHDLLEGVAVKQLYVDRERGTVTSLFKLQPGASLPTHFHAGTEECLVLEGDLRTDEIILHQGDYHCAPKGSRHPLIMSVTGALLLIVAQASPDARVV